MIDNNEFPLDLPWNWHSIQTLWVQFAGLSKVEQNRIINGARDIESRDEMRMLCRVHVHEPKTSFF